VRARPSYASKIGHFMVEVTALRIHGAQGRASPPLAFSAQRIAAITRRFVRLVLRPATCEAAEDGELPLDQCKVRHNDTEHFAHALPPCPACLCENQEF